MTVAVSHTFSQCGKAGAAAMDGGSGEHGLAGAAVELGEIVPCIGGCQG